MQRYSEIVWLSETEDIAIKLKKYEEAIELILLKIAVFSWQFDYRGHLKIRV